MKFISYLFLCLIAFMAIWVVTFVFASNASICSLGAGIAVSVAYALISNKYHGKHDK